MLNTAAAENTRVTVFSEAMGHVTQYAELHIHRDARRSLYFEETCQSYLSICAATQILLHSPFTELFIVFRKQPAGQGLLSPLPPIHRSVEVEVELCEEALRIAKASRTTCHTLHSFTPALWSHTQPDLLRASRRGCVQEQAFQKPKASRTATHPSTLLAM